MMSRDAERKAALQRKRGKAEKYMKVPKLALVHALGGNTSLTLVVACLLLQLMIRRRFARLEMFKRFYATWTKEYDPVSGQPFYQNQCVASARTTECVPLANTCWHNTRFQHNRGGEMVQTVPDQRV